MRSLVACMLILGCDAGPQPKPAPPPPAAKPAPTPVPTPAPPPPPLRVIDLQLAGLGVWKGMASEILWHVHLDLSTAHLAVTDPGGKTTERALDADVVREYTRLARVAHDEIHAQPSHSCTDRSEVLTIDALVLSDSCPLADPGASALSAKLQRELK